MRLTSPHGEIIHLRPSGNAPELRCYAESDTPERAEYWCGRRSQPCYIVGVRSEIVASSGECYFQGVRSRIVASGGDATVRGLTSRIVEERTGLPRRYAPRNDGSGWARS
nr:hypothetical protein [Rhodocyclus purpureus]